jgi:putative membrane protein
MNRRHAIALSGAALPWLALGSVRAVAQTAASPSMGPLDMTQYQMMTLMVGSLSLQSSQLALQRAAHPKVQQFASFESAEQTTIAQVIANRPCCSSSARRRRGAASMPPMSPCNCRGTSS